MKLIDLPEFVN
jgi:hypothetical protein